MPSPSIDVPLLPGDGAVNLNVQHVFDRAYVAGPFRRRIRYGTDAIVPPLAMARAEWTQGLLSRSADQLSR
jgi:hypothetical protein